MHAFLLIVSLLIAFEVRPYQGGLIAHATSPDGTQCVVSQSWNGWNGGEFYTVRLHARKPGGDWTWHYIDHEASHWSGCKLRFSSDGKTLHLSGGDKQPRSFNLTQDEASTPPPYLPEEFKEQP
ncbi:hypothetical protein OJ996_01340 [Luteolibacter sp. GHJ8]|uniref:Uncharacterized protein n=1 Tax=Luteolibacter rhizosphaerae TaxID=2989719 RepID=A0ABT3FY43_9BACT|nr:hypothetical protein [Luteolibacter rhizosphaerae]MCW1912196.1 hypothetical protein [Luteolibacter rhizosphaerae]